MAIHIDEWNWVKSPEINTPIYSYLTKEDTINLGKKFFWKMVLVNTVSRSEGMKLDPNIAPQKTDSR